MVLEPGSSRSCNLLELSLDSDLKKKGKKKQKNKREKKDLCLHELGACTPKAAMQSSRTMQFEDSRFGDSGTVAVTE